MNRFSLKSLTRVLKTCHALWLPHRHHVFHGSPSKRGLPAVCWTDPRSEPWTEFSWISVGDQMEVWGPWPDLSCSPVINQRDVQLRRKLRLSPETRPFIYLFFLMFSEHPSLPCDVLQPAQPAAAAAAALVDVSLLLHIVQMDSLVWYKNENIWLLGSASVKRGLWGRCEVWRRHKLKHCSYKQAMHELLALNVKL